MPCHCESHYVEGGGKEGKGCVLQKLTANVSMLLSTKAAFKLFTSSKQSHRPLLSPTTCPVFISQEKSPQADRSRDQNLPGCSVCHHRPVGSCRPPAQGGWVLMCGPFPPALTYSTRWGWMQPAGRRCVHWAPGCAHGTQGAHACSFCLCLSHPSAARCQRFGASGCLRSRCCTEESPGHENHLTEQKKTPQTHLRWSSKHLLWPAMEGALQGPPGHYYLKGIPRC